MSEGGKGGTWPLVLGIASPLGHIGALLAALGLLLGSSPGAAWRFFNEGGWFTWILLLAGLASLPVMIAIAAWLTRNLRAPSWPLLVPGASLMLLGSTGVWFAMSLARHAFPGRISIDPTQGARILAETVAEALTLNALGGLLATALFASAAGVVGARSLARVRGARFGGVAAAALVAGLAGLLATTAARFAWPPLRWGVPIGALAAFTGCVSITLCAASMGSKDEDPSARAAAMGDLLTCTMLSIGGVAVAAVATRTFTLIRGFAAVAGLTGDASQRLRVVAELWSEASASSWASWAYAIPVLLACATVVAVRATTIAGALRQRWATLLGAAAAAALAGGGPQRQASRLADALVEVWKIRIADDVELVRVPDAAGTRDVQDLIVSVGRDRIRCDRREIGTPAQLDTPRGCREIVDKAGATVSVLDIVLAIDRATPYARIACLAEALAARRRSGLPSAAPSAPGQPRAWIALMVQPPAEVADPLPAPFDRLATAPRAIPVDVAREPVELGELPPWFFLRPANRVDIAREPVERARHGAGRPPAKHALHLGTSAWTVRGPAEGSKSLPAADRPGLDRWLATLASRQDRLLVTAHPEVQAADLLAAVGMSSAHAAVELGPASALPPPLRGGEDASNEEGAGTGGIDGESAATAGHGDAGGTSVRMGAATVDGRLAPEVIERIVRRSTGRLRLCYEAGLKRDPKLQGRVAVRFVIARDGTVSNVANAGSDLTDAEVVSCVMRAFSTLVYPQPWEGIVTVVFPIVFTSR
jgi:hypothetical protein